MKKLSNNQIVALVRSNTLGSQLEGRTATELKEIQSVLSKLKETPYTIGMIDMIGDLIQEVKEAKKEEPKKTVKKKKEVKKEEPKKEVKKEEPKKEVKKEVKKEAKKEAKKKLNFKDDIKPGLQGVLEIKELDEKFYFKVTNKTVKKEERYYITGNKVVGKAGKLVSLDYYTIGIYGGDKKHLFTVEVAQTEINKTCFKIADVDTNEVMNFKLIQY